MTDHLRDRIAEAIRASATRLVLEDDGYPSLHYTEYTEQADAVLAALLAAGADREHRIPLDDLTETDLGQLYDDLDRYTEILGELNETLTDQARALAALRQVARGYCPHCGRGDAAPTVDDWEQQKQRADQAEAALRDVLAQFDGIRNSDGLGDIQHYQARATPREYARWQEAAGPTATQATDSAKGN